MVEPATPRRADPATGRRVPDPGTSCPAFQEAMSRCRDGRTDDHLVSTSPSRCLDSMLRAFLRIIHGGGAGRVRVSAGIERHG